MPWIKASGLGDGGFQRGEAGLVTNTDTSLVVVVRNGQNPLDVQIIPLSDNLRLLDGSTDCTLPDALFVSGVITEVPIRTQLTLARQMPGGDGLMMTDSCLVSRKGKS